MATTKRSSAKKTAKKTPAKRAPSKKAMIGTASEQGPRSSKHGNVTYFSVPKENPECYRRCSPPYRRVDKPTGIKTTLVRYSHRNLTITSPGMSEQVRPKVKASAKKTAAKKTTVKAPARKAPAKAVQCGCAVSPAKAPAKKKVPAKKTPFKAPASWTVPNVGGVFKGPEQAVKKGEVPANLMAAISRGYAKKAPAKKKAAKKEIAIKVSTKTPGA